MIFLRFVKHFRLDASGSIFILAALLIPMCVILVAGAIEYSRINSTKSQLDSYALIASQQGTNAARIALSQVTNPQQTDINNAISTGTTAANNAFTQMAAKVKSATATPTSTGAFNSTSNVINVNLNYTAQFNFVFKFMSTVFGSSFAGKNNTNLTVAVQRGLADGTELLHEDFQLGNNNYQTGFNYNGTSFPAWKTTNTWMSGNAHTMMQYGDATGPTGKGVLALNDYGNTSISTPINFPANGAYELRYWYHSETHYSQLSPGYLCGSTNADVSNDWTSFSSNLKFTNTNATTLGWIAAYTSNYPAQQNRIAVYLDPATSTTTPPSNISPTTNGLIDVCTYSENWIQRSVMINITTTGTYWLTFQSEKGTSGSGGMLSTVQVCFTACAGSVAEPNPYKRIEVGNNNAPYVFYDGFNQGNRNVTSWAYQSPIQDGTEFQYQTIYNISNMSSNSLADITLRTYNFPVNIFTPQGTYQYNSIGGIDTTTFSNPWVAAPLDMFFPATLSTNFQGGPPPSSSYTSGYRSFEKKVFLTPGYYLVSYTNSFSSGLAFGNLPSTSTTYCTDDPDTYGTLTQQQLYKDFPSLASNPYWGRSSPGTSYDDVNVSMGHDQLVTHYARTASIYNVSVYYAYSMVAPDVSLGNVAYNSIHYCNYVHAIYFPFQSLIKIQKPNYYWLLFRGAADGYIMPNIEFFYPIINNISILPIAGLTQATDSSIYNNINYTNNTITNRNWTITPYPSTKNLKVHAIAVPDPQPGTSIDLSRNGYTYSITAQ